MRTPLRALLVASVVLGLALPDAPSAAAPPPSRVLAFADRTSGAVLTIETAAGSSDLGRFAVRVPGRGVFVGTDAATIESRGDGVFEVRYRGGLEFIPQVTAVSQHFPGRLEAELRPDRLAGEADLRVAGATPAQDLHVHIETARLEPEGALRVARAFEAAVLAGDWASVHALLASTLGMAMSAQAFAASVSAQEASVGRITALQRGAPSGLQVASGGVAFVVIPYTATYALPQGGEAVRRFDAYFVFEEGSWRLWFTAER